MDYQATAGLWAAKAAVGHALPRVLAVCPGIHAGSVVTALADFTTAVVRASDGGSSETVVWRCAELQRWLASLCRADADPAQRIVSIEDADVMADGAAAFLCQTGSANRRVLIVVVPSATADDEAGGGLQFAVCGVASEATQVHSSRDGLSFALAARDWVACFNVRDRMSGAMLLPFSRGTAGLATILGPESGDAHHVVQTAGLQVALHMSAAGGSAVLLPSGKLQIAGGAPVALEGVAPVQERSMSFTLDASAAFLAAIDVVSCRAWIVDLVNRTVARTFHLPFLRAAVQPGSTMRAGGLIAMAPLVDAGGPPCELAIEVLEMTRPRRHWSDNDPTPTSQVRSHWLRVFADGARWTRLPMLSVIDDAAVVALRHTAGAKRKGEAAGFDVGSAGAVRVTAFASRVHPGAILAVRFDAGLRPPPIQAKKGATAGPEALAPVCVAQLRVKSIAGSASRAHGAINRALAAYGAAATLTRLRHHPEEPAAPGELPTAPFVRATAHATISAAPAEDATNPVTRLWLAERMAVLGAPRAALAWLSPVAPAVAETETPRASASTSSAPDGDLTEATRRACDFAYPVLAAQRQAAAMSGGPSPDEVAATRCSAQLKTFVADLEVFRATAAADKATSAAAGLADESAAGATPTPSVAHQHYLDALVHKARSDPTSLALQDVLELGTRLVVARGAAAAFSELRPFAVNPNCHPDVVALHSMCGELVAAEESKAASRHHHQ